MNNLYSLIQRQAQLTPAALAVKDASTSMTYGELEHVASRFAQTLATYGVRQGERVGIWLDKTVYTVAAMQGVLCQHATYVPLDPLSPTARIHDIIQDCGLKAVITTRSRQQKLTTSDLHTPIWLYLESGDLVADLPEPSGYSPAIVNDNGLAVDTELAYILYTSGSTGKPKGVCISHRNALAFIEWAVETLAPGPQDRFANHAPFHFDISVLDLYVAFSVGAMVFLISDTITFMPERLVNSIVQEQLTIWYSVPSALMLMMEQGGLLTLQEISLRAILFAGEPFPLKQFQKLYQRWPHVRYLNLYGPTETNVCTYYEVTALPGDQMQAIPIGKACSGDHIWAQKEDGTIAQPGEVGELMVEGPTVMVGYWGQPVQGQQPYATGDLVRQEADGNYAYLGRRDHMVKVRGYRIELAEIEIVLAQYPNVAEAAVVVGEQEGHARLVAFLVTAHAEQRPSLLSIKRHCAERLPRYMIVDDIFFLSALPRTRNGKIDRLLLSQNASKRQNMQNLER